MSCLLHSKADCLSLAVSLSFLLLFLHITFLNASTWLFATRVYISMLNLNAFLPAFSLFIIMFLCILMFLAFCLALCGGYMAPRKHENKARVTDLCHESLQSVLLLVIIRQKGNLRQISLLQEISLQFYPLRLGSSVKCTLQHIPSCLLINILKVYFTVKRTSNMWNTKCVHFSITSVLGNNIVVVSIPIFFLFKPSQ